MAMISEYRERTTLTVPSVKITRVLRVVRMRLGHQRSFRRSAGELSRLSPRLLRDVGLDHP